MRRIIKLISMVAILSIFAGCGQDKTAPDNPDAAESTGDKDLSSASLELSDEGAVTPGGEVSGAVVLDLASGWHTYGDPPGDSGMPPDVEFDLPSEWSADLLQLPEPEEFEDGGGVSLGYEDQLKIPFVIKVPQGIDAGSSVEMGVDVQYLICKDVCLSQSAQLEAEIVIQD